MRSRGKLKSSGFVRGKSFIKASALSIWFLSQRMKARISFARSGASLLVSKIQRVQQSLGFGVLANLPVGVGEIKEFLRDVAFWQAGQAAHGLERG